MIDTLRILHVDTEHAWRGGEQQALWLAQGLAARGQHNVVACQPGSPLAIRARSAGLAVLPVTMRGEADLRAVATLRDYARRHRIDVMHAHTPHAHTLVALAGRGGVAARVVTRRVDFTPRRGLASLKYRAGFDRIVAVSHAVKSALVHSGVDPRRVTVVPSGIDVEQGWIDSASASFSLRDPDVDALRAELGLTGHRGPIVGCIAALDPHKGIDQLIEATPHLMRRVPDLRVVVLGEGPERHMLEHRINRLGLHEVVLLPGFSTRTNAFLRMARVYVVPSAQEGLNTSLAEAMAAECPVVATAVGGIPELVHDGVTGVLVPPGDPRSLAGSVADLLSDTDRGRRLGAAARNHVTQNFSLEGTIEGNLSVYRELVDAGRELSALSA